MSTVKIQHMVEKQHQFFNLVHVIYERTLNFKSIFFEFPEFFQDIFIFSQDFPDLEIYFSNFQVFQGVWEPCITTNVYLCSNCDRPLFKFLFENEACGMKRQKCNELCRHKSYDLDFSNVT